MTKPKTYISESTLLSNSLVIDTLLISSIYSQRQQAPSWPERRRHRRPAKRAEAAAGSRGLSVMLSVYLSVYLTICLPVRS